MLYPFRISKWLAVAALLLLGACSTEWETETEGYRLTLPGTPGSQRCVRKCELVAQQCRVSEVSSYKTCQARAQRQSYSVGGVGGASTGASAGCPPATGEYCLADFRSCFSECGGDVVADKSVPPGNILIVPAPAPVAAADSAAETGEAASDAEFARTIQPLAATAARTDPVAPRKVAGVATGTKVELLSTAPNRGPDINSVSVVYGKDGAMTVNDLTLSGPLASIEYGEVDFAQEQIAPEMELLVSEYQKTVGGETVILNVISDEEDPSHAGLVQFVPSRGEASFAIVGEPTSKGFIGKEATYSGGYAAWSDAGEAAGTYFGLADFEINVIVPQGIVEMAFAPPSGTNLWGEGVELIRVTANIDPDSNQIWGEEIDIVAEGEGAKPDFETLNLIGGLFENGDRAAGIFRIIGVGGVEAVGFWSAPVVDSQGLAGLPADKKG